MARTDDWSNVVPPLQHPADPLRFVKELIWGLAMDKFALCRHRRYTDQPDDIQFFYNKVVPRLVEAILADDPEWNPDNEWLKGQRPPTAAKSTGALRWFVEIQELQKATFEMSQDFKTTALYDRMYRSSDRNSCFLDDLRAALMKGDPDWRGPYIEDIPPLPT